MRDELRKIANGIPMLGQVEAFARDYLGFTDASFIREWCREMQMSFWCDEFGNLVPVLSLIAEHGNDRTASIAELAKMLGTSYAVSKVMYFRHRTALLKLLCIQG